MPCNNCTCMDCATWRARKTGHNLPLNAKVRCDKCGHTVNAQGWLIGYGCGIFGCDGKLREMPTGAGSRRSAGR